MIDEEAALRAAAGSEAMNQAIAEGEEVYDRLASVFAQGFKVPLEFIHGDINLPSGAGLPGYANGTDGYEYFGAGTPVMLHGWEKVTPRGQDEGRGAAPAGDTIVDSRSYYDVTFELHTPVGAVDTIRKAVDEEIAPRLIELMNKGGAPKRRMREALGVE